MTEVQFISEKFLFLFFPKYSFPWLLPRLWPYSMVCANSGRAAKRLSPGVTPRDQPWPVGLKAGACGRPNSREGHRGLRTFRLSGYSVALLINVRLINCRLINGPADQ